VSCFIQEMKGLNCSIVRELHVYGSAVPVHSRDPTKFQHRGYGVLLMEEAERIAREEHGSSKILVISGMLLCLTNQRCMCINSSIALCPVGVRGHAMKGVGTRHYYRKLGYELDGPYMSKLLA